MWNDGPAKQPWLNYFNEYELQHCCFGGDGDDSDSGGNQAEGYVDEAFSTSRQGTASAATSAAQSAASAADSQTGQNTAGGVGIDDDPDSLTADQAAAAAAAADAAADAQLGPEAQQAAADAVAAEEMGIDIGDVAGGLAGANVSMQEIDALEDLGLIGYNERTDLGYFDKLDADVIANAEAKAAQVQADLRSRPGLEDEVVSINPVTGDFEYSSFAGALAGGGQGLVDLYSEFGPGAIAMDAARGFRDMVTGLPGAVADVVTDISTGLRNEVADIFGVSPSEVTQEQVNAVTSGVGPDAGIGEFSDVSPTQTATAMGVSPQQAIDTAQIDFTNLERAVDNSGMYSGFGDMPGYSSPTESALSSDFTAMQNQADLNAITSAYEEAERARTGTQLDRDISAYEEAERARSGQLDRDISAYEEAENAMFGGGYAGTGVGSPVGSDSAGDDPIILPKKKKEEEEKPKSVMAQYFERLGVPSPYAPSTTQSASPYQAAVAAQPAGAPEDLFAKMARIRRQEALKTPKFNYTGYAPFSPNLYAAAYGISPEEARKRIPALPKLKQTIGFPDDDEDETTEAYSGGGLNTLMRTR